MASLDKLTKKKKKTFIPYACLLLLFAYSCLSVRNIFFKFEVLCLKIKGNSLSVCPVLLEEVFGLRCDSFKKLKLGKMFFVKIKTLSSLIFLNLN